MKLPDLTDRTAVLRAVAEYDQLGRDAFLTKYDFRSARDYFLVVDGHEYDSQAIVGAAFQYQFPDSGPLNWTQIHGGLRVVSKLRELGFEVRGPGFWWHASPTERYWVEIRRVLEGLGRELRCPFTDAAGNHNGWWDLVDEVKAGDSIYHWNADQARFVGCSVATGVRGVDEGTGERIVELNDFIPLTVDIGLPQLRAMAQDLKDVRDAIARQHTNSTLYLPFQFRRDGLRLMSNYFTKLPYAMHQQLFGADGLGEDDLPDPPEEEGAPLSADSDVHGRPGGFLRPFKVRADTDYISRLSGGSFKRGRTHETLVNNFAAWLEARGLLAASNAAIDLGLQQPPVIIEAKVIRSDGWAAAIREAIGQLYEYRYFQIVDPQSSLIFLASREIPERWLRYLDDDRQIGAVWPTGGGFKLTRRARRAFGLES